MEILLNLFFKNIFIPLYNILLLTIRQVYIKKDVDLNLNKLYQKIQATIWNEILFSNVSVENLS